MASLEAVEPLFFVLVRSSPGAEGVLLNQDSVIHSTSVLRDFHVDLLGALSLVGHSSAFVIILL
jgi:hypothetical protein